MLTFGRGKFVEGKKPLIALSCEAARLGMILYKNKNHVFRVTTATGDSWLFQAQSEQEVSMWGQALSMSIGAALSYKIEKTRDEIEGLQKWRSAMLLQFQEKGGQLAVLSVLIL